VPFKLQNTPLLAGEPSAWHGHHTNLHQRRIRTGDKKGKEEMSERIGKEDEFG